MENGTLEEPDYTTATYAILTVDIVLMSIAVIGRTASRKMMNAPLSIDDTLTYIAFSANLGLVACGLLLTAYGAVDSSVLAVLTNEDQFYMLAAYNIFATLYAVTITLIKISLLFLYKRIFTLRENWFRRAWWCLIALTLLWTVVCIDLIAVQGVTMSPRTGFSTLGLGITGTVNAFSDILIVSLPVAMISKLKLRKKQKIALMSIFGIGGIASMVSLIRATILFINRGQVINDAYSGYLDIVLTATESSAGLMCACLPLTKPLVLQFNRWIHKLHGSNTDHHGWTSVTESSQEGTSVQHNRKNRKAHVYHERLFPVKSTKAESRANLIESGESSENLGWYEMATRCECGRSKGSSIRVTVPCRAQRPPGPGWI